MKRMILAILLLVLCFAFCISSYFTLDKRTQEIIALLESASADIMENNTEQAEIKIKKCEDKWNENQNLFSVFLNHKMLENLSISVPSLLPLMKKSERDIALEKIEESINGLKAIMDEQKIKIGNIL